MHSSWLQGVPTNVQLTFADLKANPDLCARLQVVQIAKDAAEAGAGAQTGGKRQKLASLIRTSCALTCALCNPFRPLNIAQWI